MVWKNIIFIVLVLLGAAFAVVVYRMRNSDSRKILRMTGKLAEYGTKNSGDGNVVLAVRSQKMLGLFADGAEISIRKSPVSESFGPMDLSGNMMRYFGCFRSVELEAENAKVDFKSTDEATVRFDGVLDGVLRDGDHVDAEADVSCRFRRIDGEWKIVSVQVEDKVKR